MDAKKADLRPGTVAQEIGMEQALALDAKASEEMGAAQGAMI